MYGHFRATFLNYKYSVAAFGSKYSGVEFWLLKITHTEISIHIKSIQQCANKQ